MWYLFSPKVIRLRFEPDEVCRIATGKGIRDWLFMADMDALFPYERPSYTATVSSTLTRWLWRYRSLLARRVAFGKTQIERGLQWFEVPSMIFERRLRPDRTLALSNVATHNHFAAVENGTLLGSHAPCIRFVDSVSDDEYFATLAILNSSTFCFWMKQVFQPKGKTSANRNHPSPERFAYEIGTTQLMRFPLPKRWAVSDIRMLSGLSRRLVDLARLRVGTLSETTWQPALADAGRLQAALMERWRQHDQVRRQMILLQEEVDWLVYYLYGLCEKHIAGAPNQERLARGQRAFELLRGHRSFVRKGNVTLAPSAAECDREPETLSADYQQAIARRVDEMEANADIDSWRHTCSSACGETRKIMLSSPTIGAVPI